MRSRRRSPEEQLKLITECHQSGLTTFEWCQQHGVKIATFYAWVNRLKQSGVIDIPAVIPTVISKQSEQPDIVKIEIENDAGAASAPEENTLPAASMQTGYPVMEVIFGDIQLRVTNEASSKLLADTIRLLRSGEC